MFNIGDFIMFQTMYIDDINITTTIVLALRGYTTKKLQQ